MRYGEIISLGRHKLMCGDATSRDDVIKLIGNDTVNLVLTDPPYGMKCQHKNGAIGEVRADWRKPLMSSGKVYTSRVYSIMQGDASSDTARRFYDIIKGLTGKQIFWGGQYFADFLPINGGWLFWDKLTGKTNFSDGELAWCSFGKRVRKYTHLWNGVCRAGTCVLNPRPRVHPTQKPVELHMKILEDFSKPDDVILDCFGGSGTTLIACEVTGRKCLMMEISPDYCELIAERYRKITGGEY